MPSTTPDRDQLRPRRRPRSRARRESALRRQLEPVEAGELAVEDVGELAVGEDECQRAWRRTSSRSRTVTVAGDRRHVGVLDAARAGHVDGNSATTRPGRLDSSRIRSPRRAASRTLWVTNRTVRPLLGDDPLELVVEDVAGDRVEGAERLVHQQHVGVLGERPGQGDALAHAARQLVRALVGELAEAHEVEQLARPARRSAVRDAAAASSAARRWPAAVRHGSSADSWNISAVRPSTPTSPAVGGRARRRREQRRLAAARGADEAHELAPADGAARCRRGRARAPGPSPKRLETSRMSTATGLAGAGPTANRGCGGRAASAARVRSRSCHGASIGVSPRSARAPR